MDDSTPTTDVDQVRSTAAPRSFVEVDGMFMPQAPATLADTGIEPERLLDLTLKLAYTMASVTTDVAVQKLRLPFHLVAELFESLKAENLVEILGAVGLQGYRFAITQRGRERAARLLDLSGYVGPAPVSLEQYSQSLEWQTSRLTRASWDTVRAALLDLVLPDRALEIAALAAVSGRSLFIYGDPGNGKTTIGHLLHKSLPGSIWVPYCIGIDHDIMVFLDPQWHEVVSDTDLPKQIIVDRRWVRIRRPFIIAGGEMTLDDVDLTYHPGRRYYEAPAHVKANGGTFLLDDFGRQRVPARQLLNRWVFPLEHGVDFLTLRTGQKVSIPFRQMLVVCTNLEPNEVMDPAFLRRMGYRLYLEDPTPEHYARIFTRYAERCSLVVPGDLVEWLLQRYALEDRHLRGCEPRDLIERARDVCRYEGRPPVLNREVMEVAWSGYFGCAFETGA